MAPKKTRNKSTKSSSHRDVRRNAIEFRDLLLSARKNYSKGRAYDAVILQKQALALGKKIFPRFEENSIVKAHTLLELGLAYSAVMTDFASGDEWTEAKNQSATVIGEALIIFTARCAERTLTVFRSEEWWVHGNDYQSPVTHTERLGPVDYLTSVNMGCGCEIPTSDTVSKLKSALRFASNFKASGYIMTLEDGTMFQGDVPDPTIASIKGLLRQHEMVIDGGDPNHASFRHMSMTEDHEERHTGTLEGGMKLVHRKIAKDVEKKGLRYCARPECKQIEGASRQFAVCSRCKWKAYCRLVYVTNVVNIFTRNNYDCVCNIIL